MVARPPTSSLEVQRAPRERAAKRAEQRDVAIEQIQRYNSEAVVVVGVPFGHTRRSGSFPTAAR